MTLIGILISTAACTNTPAWACDAQTKTGLDPRLLYAVCLVESSGKVDAFHAHDGKGHSYGVCQIKLGTARYLGFKGSSKELMNPYVNANYAAKYLSKNISKHGSVRKAISAYNAGRPIEGNEDYVNKVMRNYRKLGGRI